MTARWWEGPLVGFDTETSGTDVESDRVVTASVALIAGDGTVEESLDVLVDPGVDIPEQATAVHGVTTERARAAGIPAAAGIAQVARALGAYQVAGVPIVGHNVSFDLTLLDRECRRYGLEPFVPTLVCDVMVLDKQLDRYRRGSRKLVDVAAHYGVTLDDAHTADADALAAVHVVRAMGRIAPFPPPDQLHRAQVAWRAEQCASLEDYFRRTKDPDTVIAREWPVLPLPVGATA